MDIATAPRGVVGSSSRRKQRWQSLSGESVVLSGGYRDEDDVSCYAAYSPCLLLETEDSPSTSDYDEMDDEMDFPLKDLPPSMATPPRSPGPQIPEPLLEDLLDLWNENMEDEDPLDFPSDDDRLFDELVDLAKFVEAEARIKSEPLSAPQSPAQQPQEVQSLHTIVVKEEMVTPADWKDSREVDPFLCAAPFSSSNWLETPPPTVPSSPSADMVDENDEEEDELLNEIYHQLEMNEEVVKNDCMWGCEELNSLQTSTISTATIKEEPAEIVESEEEVGLRLRRAAAENDHCYAAPYSEEEAGQNLRILPARAESPADEDERGPCVKKTKILVPLKDLMETLQQKTYLVAPLGPGKKVIRLTGSDSVKGVLPFSSSSSALASFLPKSSPALKCVQQQQKLKVKFESRSSGSLGSRSPKLCLLERPGGKKTKTHNNMERMRRIDLRNSFENLKKLVPPLSKSSKSSKVEILRKAEEYIRALKSLEGRLLKETSSLRAKNDLLRERISGLVGG